MSTTMLALGPFPFGIATAAYTELQRQMQFKHGATARIGERDAFQYLGPGDESITLQGAVAPEITGTLASITRLETMGRGGNAYVLVDGAGYVYGVYVIDSMETTQRYHLADGTPRRVDFTLSLRRTDTLPADEPPATGRQRNAA
ncbi:phage tail protein [Dyella sp. ASV21]|uniref:phage tail protein n=1 Tax=Dyella sp. ASV21 TaxID=2795114 RepID=UPI001E5B43DF|nr:phage tail protein [Dyella sp. ASV21]